MGQKLTWGELADFSDKAPIQDAIALLEKLGTTYEKMIETVKNASSNLAGEMGDLRSEAQKLSDSMGTYTKNLEANKGAILNAAGESQKLVDQYGMIIKGQNDNALSLEKLTEGYNTSIKAREGLKKSIEAEAGSIDGLKAKIDEAVKAYKAMGDATDKAVKDAQIQKVKELNIQYQQANKALNDAKKAADLAAGSYNELQSKVSAATKELKGLEGGMEGNSAKFKELQKTVKDGNDKLKEFDQAIGLNQRNVGDYGIVIEKLDENLGGMFGKLKGVFGQFAEAGLIFGTVAAVIAASGEAVKTFFERTEEGALEAKVVASELRQVWQDFLNIVAVVGGAIWNGFKTQVAGVFELLHIIGEEAAELAHREEELQKRKIAAIESGAKKQLEIDRLTFEAREALDRSDEERLDRAKQADALAEERSKGRISRAKEEYDIAVKLLELDTRSTNRNPTLEEQQKIAELAAKISEAEDSYYQGARRRQALIVRIELEIEKRREENALREVTLQKDIDSAIIQADIERNSVILNNLRSTEEQKKQAYIKTANDQIELIKNTQDKALEASKTQAQSRAKDKLGASFFSGMSPEFVRDIIEMDKSYTLEVQKINQEAANATLAVNDKLQKELTDNQVAFLSKRLDRELKFYTAEMDIQKAILQANVQFNQQILASDDATLAERVKAIQDTSEDKLKILEIDRDKAIKAAEVETQKKIALEGNQADNMRSLARERDKILEQFKTNVIGVNAETTRAVRENVFTVLNRDLTNLNNKVKTGANDQLDKLAKAFQSGDVETIAQYNRQRNDIIRKSEIEQAKNTLDAYEKILSSSTISEKQRTDVALKASEARKMITELEVNYEIKKREELNNKLRELGAAAFDFAKNLSQYQLDNKIAQYENELAVLSEQKDKEIEVAGDNKAAIDQINREFAAKQKQIQREEAAAKRRDAIFQKEIDAFKIITNTAVAVTEVYPNIPLSIAIGALGAIELATVLARPIPQYGKGIKSSPEGWAIVGERGREIGLSDGKPTMYDKPTLAYLAANTTIFNNMQTENIMERLGTAEDVFGVLHGVRNGFAARQEGDGGEVGRVLNRRFDSLEDTVRNKRELHINITSDGLKLLAKDAAAWVNFMDKNYP